MRCSSGDARGVRNLHMGGRGFYETAVAAGWRRGVDVAAQRQRAKSHIAQKANRALALVQGLRPNDAAAVYGAVGSYAIGERCEEHLAAVGLDQARVVGRCVGSTAQHRQVHKAGFVELQAQRLGADQAGRAQRGGNAAFIGNAHAQQCHKAAVGGVDLALVDNAAARATAQKLVVAGGKGGAGAVERGGDQTAYVHHRAFAKHNATGVDQKDIAVGAQAAQDGGRGGPQHLVYGHGLAAGLDELHDLGGAHIEAGPVNDGIGTALCDGGGACRTTDTGTAAGDHATCGRGVCIGTQNQEQGQGDCGAGARVVRHGLVFKG